MKKLIIRFSASLKNCFLASQFLGSISDFKKHWNINCTPLIQAKSLFFGTYMRNGRAIQFATHPIYNPFTTEFFFNSSAQDKAWSVSHCRPIMRQFKQHFFVFLHNLFLDPGHINVCSSLLCLSFLSQLNFGVQIKQYRILPPPNRLNKQ